MIVSIKNYNGHNSVAYKRPTIKLVNFYSKQNCKFLMNLITNVIAWLWNNQLDCIIRQWLTVWLFDECARSTHCRKIMCDGLQEPNFMGRFSLILKWVSRETPLDILEMSHLQYMFGKQHEWDGMSVRHVWIWNVRRNWDGKPRDCQLREGSPHCSLTKE